MQEQETKKRTPRAKKTAEEKPEEAKRTAEEKENTKVSAGTFTLEQVQAMIAEALKKHDEEKQQETNVRPASGTEGTVTMFFQAEVNDASELPLGPNGKYGVITGKTATITIPKRDFIADFRTTTVQYYLKTRNLVVIDGLTDDERRIYGLDYKDGEYLEPAVYKGLLDMGDRVLDVFPKLSVTWREMIAQKFAEAYENKTLKCSRQCLVELNRMSKQDYKDLPKGDERKKGGFWAIIHGMNADDEASDDE